MVGRSVPENLRMVHGQMVHACEQAGRSFDSVRLIAVSKFVESNRIVEAHRGGIRDFGENYVQEAIEKQGHLPPECASIQWHFIGRLQSNKLKHVLLHFQWIHSVDSVEKTLALDGKAGELNVRPNVLLQINIANEPTKGGFHARNFVQTAADGEQYKYLWFNGVPAAR